MENKHTLLSYVIPGGDIALSIAVVAEMIFFPSIANAVGCIMTIVCWFLFSRRGLSTKIIRLHPFAWLMFLSMSMYRILPLFATLLEGKPISYGFSLPYMTFFGEMILYIISLLAFLFAIRRKRYNTRVHVWLNKIDYYDSIPDQALWILGIIGVFSQIYEFIFAVQIGDIFGKFISAFVFLRNAPFLLFFPALYKKNSTRVFNNNIYLWLYMSVILLLSFATNSRQAILEPIGSFMLMLILTYIYNYKKASKVFSRYIVVALFCGIIVAPFLSNASTAMLSIRKSRANLNPLELLEQTLAICFDSEKIARLNRENAAQKRAAHVGDYDEDWTEEYVSNFALNRYCNMRITDATLYYQEMVGMGNRKMLHNYKESVLKLLPTPVLRAIGLSYDKSKIYSPGDYLYYLCSNNPYALGTMRVTSHLADGLATFGILYFPIQFLLFWLCFLALDCFCVQTVNGIRYSVFALFCVFSYLAMFQNANGCFGELSYLLRAFPQFLLISWIGTKLALIFTGGKSLME